MRSEAADTTPPTLDQITSPDDFGAAVAKYMPLLLTFSEEMAPQQSITWSSNIDTAKLSYAWEDSTTLSIAYNSPFQGASSWPDNSLITWQLNPTANSASNFKDIAGNSLAIGKYSGSFAVGTVNTNNPSTNTPCESGNAASSYFSVSKSVNYLQSGPTSIAIDSENPPSFGASIFMPASAGLATAKISLPSGASHDLSVFTFSTNTTGYYYDTNSTQALLDQAYPSGNYKITITGGVSGNASVSLTTYPPTPQIANYAQLQAINPAAAFTIQWNAFTGAGQYDGIYLYIMDKESGETVFTAPDECATPKVELAATAPSISVPAGTLTSGKTYELHLSFTHLESYNVALSSAHGNSMLSKSVNLTIQTTGGTTTLTAPKFTKVSRSATGLAELQLSCMAQRTVVIQSSTTLNDWTTALTTNAPAASLTVSLPASPKTFFRAIQQ